MPRLFTAIELAPDLRQAIETYQRQAARVVDPGGRALRLAPSHQFHLTLVFVGEVAADIARRVRERLSGPLDVEPFTVSVGAPGVFPQRGAPRVWWLGLGSGLSPLAQVHERLVARLAQTGVVLEPRAYRPHLTLGRWREGRWPRTAPEWPAPPPMPAQLVSRVTLFESHLRPGGAEHVTLEHMVLGGGTAALP